MSGENKYIDQVLKQKFENFAPEPPESVWLKVKHKITGQPGSPLSGTHIIMPVITGIALLMALIAILINIQSDNHLSFTRTLDSEPVFYASANIDDAVNMQHAFNAASQNISNTNQEKLNPYFNSSDKITAQESNRQTQNIKVRKPLVIDPPSLAADVQELVEAPALQSVTEDNKVLLVTDPASDISRSATGFQMDRQNPGSDIHLAGNSNNASLAERPSSLQEAYNDYLNDHKPGWSFGLFFNPEIVFYNDDGISQNRSYGVDLNAYYRFSDYFIQSGLGIKITNDWGNYHIDYNEYLGSYEHVYEVTFDSTNQGIIPTYHTYTLDVYDSINHLRITEAKARYTYFELPILFGYGKRLHKFSYYISGGPNISFLLDKKLDGITYPEEQVRIVNVDRKVPVRLNTNWQLLLRIGLGYNLNDNFSLMIEPTFKYYMKSEYDFSNQSSTPYSFGARVGIIYHLNK